MFTSSYVNTSASLGEREMCGIMETTAGNSPKGECFHTFRVIFPVDFSRFLRFPPKKKFSKWRRSSKSSEAIFVFVQFVPWQNNNVLVDKVEIPQEKIKMMPRYSLNLDNLMYFRFVEKCSIIDQKFIILPTAFYGYIIKRTLHGGLKI